jgi:hypothetical protein
MDIRNGVITRDQGIRLVEKYDTRYPKHAVESFCAHFRMTREEFDSLAESFANRAIFERKDGKFLHDIDGSLVMKPHIFELRRNPQASTESLKSVAAG